VVVWSQQLEQTATFIFCIRSASRVADVGTRDTLHKSFWWTKLTMVLWLALVAADFQATLAQFKASEQGCLD
jgi:hypothetical protein